MLTHAVAIMHSDLGLSLELYRQLEKARQNRTKALDLVNAHMLLECRREKPDIRLMEILRDIQTQLIGIP